MIKCALFHPCRALLHCVVKMHSGFFHYCFPTHIWVSTAQQQHWCWSFSWLRWRALPTPEGGYHFQISKPNRELPSLGFSNHVIYIFFGDAPPFLQSSSHPGLLLHLAHPGCPGKGLWVLLAVLCFSWNVPCRNGSMTLERLHYIWLYLFLGWMKERNQLLGAATEFQKLIANYSKLLYF